MDIGVNPGAHDFWRIARVHYGSSGAACCGSASANAASAGWRMARSEHWQPPLGAVSSCCRQCSWCAQARSRAMTTRLDFKTRSRIRRGSGSASSAGMWSGSQPTSRRRQLPANPVYAP